MNGKDKVKSVSVFEMVLISARSDIIICYLEQIKERIKAKIRIIFSTKEEKK